VFLDGELYRDRIGAVGIIDGLHQAGRIDDSWFVFVSMESPEARWRECPCYPPFARFISSELLPWLEHTHTGVKHARHRVLAGLSYTGLAAAYVASEAPGLFHKVISQSGSFWWNDCWLIKQTDRWSQPLGTEFHLDVGTRETQENVQHREDVLQVVSQIDGVRRFRSLLHSHGHAVRSVEFDGGHEFTAWAGTLPAALAWALPRKPEPIRAPADRE
jgi:enterochelin esterase family protein